MARLFSASPKACEEFDPVTTPILIAICRGRNCQNYQSWRKYSPVQDARSVPCGLRADCPRSITDRQNKMPHAGIQPRDTTGQDGSGTWICSLTTDIEDPAQGVAGARHSAPHAPPSRAGAAFAEDASRGITEDRADLREPGPLGRAEAGLLSKLPPETVNSSSPHRRPFLVARELQGFARVRWQNFGRRIFGCS